MQGDEPDISGCITDEHGNPRCASLIASNVYLDYFDPDPEMICIEDIATGLGNCCRFNGQIRPRGLHRFLSVAEHSINCAILAQSWCKREGVALHALLHDASEAYTGDMARPLKMTLPDFMKVENRLQGIIDEKFGLRKSDKPFIKEIDNVVCQAEKQAIYPDNHDLWPGFDHVPDNLVEVRFLSPEDAHHEFLMLYKRITNGSHQRASCIAFS